MSTMKNSGLSFRDEAPAPDEIVCEGAETRQGNCLRPALLLSNIFVPTVRISLQSRSVLRFQRRTTLEASP
jgi:hypothetical protein